MGGWLAHRSTSIDARLCQRLQVHGGLDLRGHRETEAREPAQKPTRTRGPATNPSMPGGPAPRRAPPMQPAEKIPRLQRLKNTARSSGDVHAALRELGGCATTKEYSLVIAVYTKLRDWREACALIDEMIRNRVTPDMYCYSSAITACKDGKQWERAVELLEGMEQAGCAPNEFHYSGAISACGKCGKHAEAMRLFDGMRAKGVRPNEVCFNAAISASKGDATRALALLSEMRERNIRPSAISYSSAVSACGAAHWQQALELLDEATASGVPIDAVCFNAAIDAVGKAGEWRRALELLDSMRGRKLRPTTVSFGSAITACEKGGELARCYELLQTMEVRGGREHAPRTTRRDRPGRRGPGGPPSPTLQLPLSRFARPLHTHTARAHPPSPPCAPRTRHNEPSTQPLTPTLALTLAPTPTLTGGRAEAGRCMLQRRAHCGGTFLRLAARPLLARRAQGSQHRADSHHVPHGHLGLRQRAAAPPRAAGARSRLTYDLGRV